MYSTTTQRHLLAVLLVECVSASATHIAGWKINVKLVVTMPHFPFY